MGKDLPVIADAFRVDGYDDALAAEHFRRLADEFRSINRAGIDRNLVGARFEKGADIVGRVDATANRQRHKNLLCGTRHDVQNDAAILVRSGDVEETKLVRPFGVVDPSNFHRIAGVPEIEKLCPFDYAPRFNVKAGNDSFGQHGSKFTEAPQTSQLIENMQSFTISLAQISLGHVRPEDANT